MAGWMAFGKKKGEREGKGKEKREREEERNRIKLEFLKEINRITYIRRDRQPNFDSNILSKTDNKNHRPKIKLSNRGSFI